MTVIDDYLKNVAAPQKEQLERIRAIVHQVVPDAEEVITYKMPGFKYKGRYLISFAEFKNHMSIFPGSTPVADLRHKLEGYITSKGTIQFTLDNPVPESVLKEIALACKTTIDKA